MDPIDGARFRLAMGTYLTGVTVITAFDGEPVGLAANSFTSVSLDPPLVSFCPALSSSTWPRIERAGSFCVNVLAEDQEDVSRVFATPGADRFSAFEWQGAPVTGAPVISGCLAWMECTTEAVHPGGDHVIVVGRVVALGVTEPPGGPLAYYRGGYRALV